MLQDYTEFEKSSKGKCTEKLNLKYNIATIGGPVHMAHDQITLTVAPLWPPFRSPVFAAGEDILKINFLFPRHVFLLVLFSA